MIPVDDGAADRDTWTPDVAAPAPEAPAASSPTSSHRATAVGCRTVLFSTLAFIAISAVVIAVVSTGGGPRAAVEVTPEALPSLEALPLDAPPLPLTDAEVEPYLSAVAQTVSVDTGMWHLAEGLAPPTNRWFSPLALQADPQPVSPLPFTVELVGERLRLSIPGGTAVIDRSTLAIDAGATSWRVVDYSDASVTLRLWREELALANVVLTRGSPVIGYHALADHAVAVDAVLEPVTSTLFRTRLGATEIAVVGPHLRLAADGRSFTVQDGTIANWVAVPDGGDLLDIAPLAVTTVVDTAVSYVVAPDVTTTTVAFMTVAGARAVFGLFTRLGPLVATESGGEIDCGLGTFTTPLGRLRVCAGTGFSYAVPTVDPLGVVAYATLPSMNLPATRGGPVVLFGGAAATPRVVASSTVRLSALATQLRRARAAGDAGDVRSLTQRLTEQVLLWGELDGCAAREYRCFAYDVRLRAMVAFDVPGVAELSDARLAQNGDVLFAAGVLAADDTALMIALRPMMTLLAADIAGSSSQFFAAHRAFDPVSGLSWSSCEAWLQLEVPDRTCDGPSAMNTAAATAAYTGVAQWAVTAGDPWLLEQMTWMLSVEQLASRSS